ncbi:hypothetical protein [Sandaracinus amylolyticus]|uniref:hypothetical protein n=1 Tax=Sandaracinus amylolyticus TaxID=927083 RepID=UPI001F344DAE|nr:hypothetical protein [Sandaracinus amylolyticus]UJR87135.1 Hypothetical protein I5071_92360 [Sandaracinus amylolyticus]
MARVETITVPSQSTTRVGREETIPRWSRRARLTLGVLTLGSVGLFALTALAVTLLMVLSPDITRERTYAPLHFVLIFAAIADYMLTLFYIWFASQNPRITHRAAWIVGMIVAPWVTQPMYWYAHVLNAPYVGDPTRDHPVPGRTAGAPA